MLLPGFVLIAFNASTFAQLSGAGSRFRILIRFSSAQLTRTVLCQSANDCITGICNFYVLDALSVVGGPYIKMLHGDN
ncbi:hypothetical protein LA080_009012 [Diaporthe eres]|nr:hypothetical protein LA080_009012 [Diaporthe eres]